MILLKFFAGMVIFLAGPNWLILAVRLEPFPGLFLQSVGALGCGIMSWYGMEIMRRQWKKL